MIVNPSAFSARRGHAVLLAAVLALPLTTLSIVGCSSKAPEATVAASSLPALVPVESGFLSDYSKLEASEQFPALKIYRDSSRKTGYRKLLFRPVEVWRGADKRLEDVPEEDLQYLADALYQALEKSLALSFEMVDEPGPGVLEISVAFTLVGDPDESIDFFTTTVPVANLFRRNGPLPAATQRFIHDCALEVEFAEVTGRTSASPGKRSRPLRTVRGAFFDARRGSDTPKGTVESWQALDLVFTKWAATLEERLDALRDGTFKPRLTVKGKPEK